MDDDVHEPSAFMISFWFLIYR